MNIFERVARHLDRWQQRHAVLAFPVAVTRKFADDRASAFAALMTYYAFLGLFPLLILLLTLVGRFLAGTQAEEAALRSTLAQLPIVGDVIRENVSALQATGFGLAVGVLGLLWGATGLYRAGQLAMSQVWNVEGVGRPGLPKRLLRALLLFVTLGVGVAASTWATQLGLLAPTSTVTRAAGLALSIVFNIAMFLLVLRILTPSDIPWSNLVVPALLAGPAWEVVQVAGTWLVARRLDRLSDLYGLFAYVLGALSWIYLGMRILLYATEINVVRVRGWWPRTLAQPPLNEADREALAAIVRNERRRPEEHIEVTWDEGASRDPLDEAG